MGTNDGRAAGVQAPEIKNSGPSAKDVVEYLRGHPEFLLGNPDVLRDLTAPQRWDGDGVVDMQKYMLDSLRGEIDSLRDCAQEVIDTSRFNMSTQTRTHAAVLAMVTAQDLDQLFRIVTDDLALLLDVDVIVIGYEPDFPGSPDLITSRITDLEAGVIDSLLGEDRDARLISETADSSALFGEASSLVRSCALARLRAGENTPEGLLALGSRGKTFHPGQGTELITFMARIFERCVHNRLQRNK